MNIYKPKANEPLDPKGNINLPGQAVPSFRYALAREAGVQNNLLIHAAGGLGDVICAEPVIRTGMQRYGKENTFSLVTKYPELFSHLKFKEVILEKDVLSIKQSDYILLKTADPDNQLLEDFISHPLTNAIDYIAMCLWKRTLTRDEKRIQLVPSEQDKEAAALLVQANTVVVHPGRTWKSRTFPKKWWDAVISGLVQKGLVPIIIGGVIDNGRASTVDVDVTGCIDLRNKQTIIETIALLQAAPVLLTNDSAPLHMAASGTGWIGFVSTVKHPDLLLHWRQGSDVFGYKMKDFGLGGLYNTLYDCPNMPKTLNLNEVDILELLKWLPEPKVLVEWAVDKL